MEKNALLAIVLSVLVLVVWFVLFPPPKPDVPVSQPGQTAEQTPTTGGAQPVTPAPVGAALPTAGTVTRQLNLDAQQVELDSPLLNLTVTTQGARIVSWKVKAHKDSQGAAVDLVSPDALQLGRLPLEVSTENQQLAEELNTAIYQASATGLTINAGDTPGSVRFSYTAAAGLQVTKEITIAPDSYNVQVKMQVSDPAQAGKVLALSWGPGVGVDLGTAQRFEPEVVSKFHENAKLNRTLLRKLTGLMTQSNLEWAAIDLKYFAVAIFPKDANNSLAMDKVAWATADPKEKIAPDRQIIIGVSQPLQEGQCQVIVYGGPKEYRQLSHAYPGFEKLINYGTFWFIAQPLAVFMTFLYGYVNNYGIVIICLTVLIKIIFYPLTYKSYKSMQRMQDLQPKMKAIQEKYKDKQQQQQATMQLYKEEGVNPMGGCLPMLLQIPVFFGLYQALLQSIELRGAPFLWMSDLSAPEPAFLKVIKPLVILMGVTMFIQQSMTPSATADKAQAQMFKVMPILFTAMFWNFPGGLVLYWFINNLLTIGQQYLINLSKKGSHTSAKSKQRTTDATSSDRKQRKKGN